MPPVRKTARKAATPAESKPEPPAAPSWPSLPPLPPYHHFELSTLLPGQIVTLPLFSAQTCKAYINCLSRLQLATTPAIPKKGEAARFNDRFEVWDEAFAEKLWTDSGLSSLDWDDVEGVTDEGQLVGLSPRIRVYRYSKGQFFDKHYDDSNTITLNLKDDGGQRIPTKCKTTWTLLIYLSGAEDGVKGGETVFYTDEHIMRSARKKKKGSAADDDEGVLVPPLVRGLALLHKHGKDCLLHEGRVVSDGEKWVLRSDLMVRA